MNAKPIRILLAEDDPDDRYLIGEAIDENQLNVRLYVVEDGEELLDYLLQRGKYEDRADWPLPDFNFVGFKYAPYGWPRGAAGDQSPP